MAEQKNASEVDVTKQQAMLVGFDDVAADKIAQIWLKVKSRHDAVNQ